MPALISKPVLQAFLGLRRQQQHEGLGSGGGRDVVLEAANRDDGIKWVIKGRVKRDLGKGVGAGAGFGWLLQTSLLPKEPGHSPWTSIKAGKDVSGQDQVRADHFTQFPAPSAPLP